MNSQTRKGPVAISRDFVPRDFQNEKPLLRKTANEAENFGHQEVVEPAPSAADPVNRREFFRAVGPASGKALTNFLRNFQLTISSLTEDVSHKK